MISQDSPWKLPSWCQDLLQGNVAGRSWLEPRCMERFLLLESLNFGTAELVILLTVHPHFMFFFGALLTKWITIKMPMISCITPLRVHHSQAQSTRQRERSTGVVPTEWVKKSDPTFHGWKIPDFLFKGVRKCLTKGKHLKIHWIHWIHWIDWIHWLILNCFELQMTKYIRIMPTKKSSSLAPVMPHCWDKKKRHPRQVAMKQLRCCRPGQMRIWSDPWLWRSVPGYVRWPDILHERYQHISTGISIDEENRHLILVDFMTLFNCGIPSNKSNYMIAEVGKLISLISSHPKN